MGNLIFIIMNTMAAFLGTPEILLIIGAILLLFGGKKIPELMRGLGKGVKEFKDATNEDPNKEKVKEESGQSS